MPRSLTLSFDLLQTFVALVRQDGDAGQVMRLLALLAPIVMAYLGRRKQEQGLDAQAVGDELQDARSHMEGQQPGLGGILGQFFDQNHDGSVADDLFRMAPGVLGSLFGKS